MASATAFNPTWMDLVTFAHAYMTCALWTTPHDDPDGPGDANGYLDADLSVEDIAPESRAKMLADCDAFVRANVTDIAGRYEQAGHDFWLTRNGHGCGFWEEPDWPHDAGQRLTKAAKAYGGQWLYVGDDGKVYVS